MTKFHKILLAFIICFGSIFHLSAQDSLKISVKVTEPFTKKPVSGAVITGTGFSGLVKTDENGEASITVIALNSEIRVWYPGYYASIQPIAGQTALTVILLPSEKYGYSEYMLLPFRGPVNEREKMTSLSAVQKSNISLSKLSAEQAFSSIPGVQKIDKSGMPGESSYFSIRGNNTLIGNGSPLIVLNGIPQFPDMNESPIIGGYSKGILNAINVHDIENITFLKGADAALYGSLGSNGVILIETDKATDLETKVQFIGQYGVDKNTTKMPVLEVSDYKRYINDMVLTAYDDMAIALNDFPYLIDDPEYYYKFLYNNNTDWQSLLYRPAFVTDNLLKIKGGDAIAKYDLSFGYLNKKGALKGTDYSRYLARINSDVNLSKVFSLFGNFSLVYADNHLQEQGMLPYTNPLIAAMKKGPLFSPYVKDAENNESPDYSVVRTESGLITNNMVSNPLAIVNKLEAQSKVYDIQLNGGLNASLNDFLKLKGIVGIYYNLNRERIFIPGMDMKAVMPLDNLLALNTVRAGVGESFNMYYAVNGTYARTYNLVHNVLVSAGGQTAINKNRYDAGKARNTASDFYKTLSSLGDENKREYWGYDEPWSWLNFYANIRYIYNHQFGAGLTASLDKASSQGMDAPGFGFFPGINLAWYAKNSSFLKNAAWLNKLTIRAELSTTGNSRFSSMYSKNHYTTMPFRGITGIIRTGIPNTQLKQEITRTYDAGLDLSLLNNRFDVTFDAYQSKTTDIIVPSSISSAFGVDYYFDNVASIENKGIELGFQAAVLMKQNLKWYVGATISKNSNKILDLGRSSSIIREFEDGSAIILEKDKPLYSFYGYQTNGVYATTEAANLDGLVNEKGYALSGGDVRFVNQNSDQVINDEDRVNLGNADPKFYGNIYTSLRYKGFELSVNLSYSNGNKAYNALRRELEAETDYGNQLTSIKRRWVAEGQVTDIPRAIYGDPKGNGRFSDRWIEDASYLKIKEVMLSYRFKFLEGTTVFVTGENLYTFTDYLGQDPEFMYSYDQEWKGFDYAKVALARSFRVGFMLNF